MRCRNTFAVPGWRGPRDVRCDLPAGHAGFHSAGYFRPGPLRRFVRKLLRS